MSLTVEQANEIFELVFENPNDEQVVDVSARILKSLKLDINDVIEKADFSKFSTEFREQFSWKGDKENLQTYPMLFLERYFSRMSAVMIISEQNLFKILEHSKPSEVNFVSMNFGALNRRENSSQILPTKFLDKILEITNFKIGAIEHSSYKNILDFYIHPHNLSMQEVDAKKAKNYGTTPLLSPQQLEYVIERSEVVFSARDGETPSVLSNLVECAEIGDIAKNMEKNLDLIFKKIKPKQYKAVARYALHALHNSSGLKILDKMDEALGTNWRHEAQWVHINTWTKKLLLQAFNKKGYEMPEHIKESIGKRHDGEEILNFFSERKIKEEKKFLVKLITKTSAIKNAKNPKLNKI